MFYFFQSSVLSVANVAHDIVSYNNNISFNCGGKRRGGDDDPQEEVCVHNVSNSKA